jgi:hypothetical protein
MYAKPQEMSSSMHLTDAVYNVQVYGILSFHQSFSDADMGYRS